LICNVLDLGSDKPSMNVNTTAAVEALATVLTAEDQMINRAKADVRGAEVALALTLLVLGVVLIVLAAL
jgi:hypothetical protein